MLATLNPPTDTPLPGLLPPDGRRYPIQAEAVGGHQAVVGGGLAAA